MNQKGSKPKGGIRMEWFGGISRRGFLKGVAAGALFSILHPFHRIRGLDAATVNSLFLVKDIPDDPFYGGGNYHEGVDALLHLMGAHDLKFYRSSEETDLGGPLGLIQRDDVVLIKVNAQWKYRGCTNSDLIRGLIQRILDHPDGFTGEVVIIENGQGRGSLNCDTASAYGGDTSVHANANDESQSFVYLVNSVFKDPRVSSYLLDPIGGTFIGATDHLTNGYRMYENVSYPCFTTAGGHRVELREGIWQGSGYSQNLKLINVPVLKYHDTGGSEITASLKHFYGVVSMADGQSSFRHYGGLGETCGKMVVSVRTPVLNIIDAIWVSHSSLTGYPENTTSHANQILASQDPVALDYIAAKYILYPISNNSRHLPEFPGIDQWLSGALNMINGRGGLYNPNAGILIHGVTKTEGEMAVFTAPGLDTTEFVKQLYRDFLNREAEPGEPQFWVTQIDSGAMTKAQVIDAFLHSQEFEGRIAPIVRLYFAYFLRIPDYGGLQYWINQYMNGMSLGSISDGFAASLEFQQRYGNLTTEEFVTLIYQNVLGRNPDPGGYTYWVGQLNSGAMTRGQLMLGFSESTEYKGLTAYEVFVTMMYVGILRRSPEQGGFDFWVWYLDSGNSELSLIDGFINSQEYGNRF